MFLPQLPMPLWHLCFAFFSSCLNFTLHWFRLCIYQSHKATKCCMLTSEEKQLFMGRTESASWLYKELNFISVFMCFCHFVAVVFLFGCCAKCLWAKTPPSQREKCVFIAQNQEVLNYAFDWTKIMYGFILFYFLCSGFCKSMFQICSFCIKP